MRVCLWTCACVHIQYMHIKRVRVKDLIFGEFPSQASDVVGRFLDLGLQAGRVSHLGGLLVHTLHLLQSLTARAQRRGGEGGGGSGRGAEEEGKR